jgi:hypothetical protein
MATAYRKIKLRRDTATALASVIPTEGEPVYITDTKQQVIGDGTTAVVFIPKHLMSASTMTSNSVLLGDDTSKAKVVAGITTDGISKVVLGVAGTSVGGIDFKNATSGTVTLSPVTGALGTVTLSLPAVTDTLVGLAATQTLTNKTLGASTSVTASITFTAGVKQTFAPNGTNAGLNVGSFAGDPSTVANGDVWYDSTANELTARINGANVALGAGGGGGSGTVSTGTAGRLAYYPSTGTTVDDFDGTSQAAIGTPSSTAATGALAFYSDTEANTSMQLRGGNVNPNIYLTRSRGTIASPTAVQSGDSLGRIMWGGYSGAAWQEVYSGIKFVTTENWSGGALGSQFVVMATIAGTTTREDCFAVHVDSNFTYLTGSKSLMASGTNQGFRVNSTNSSLAYMSLCFAGSQKATIGVGGANDDWISGSIVDDMNLRSHASKSINFSSDNGASIAMRVVASTGQIAILKNITSTNTTTGSLVVTGGVGVSGAMFIGGTAEVSGIATFGVVKLVTSLRDTNSNNLLLPSATASAVNEITIANAATGGAPYLRASGTDTDVTLELQPKAAGYVRIAHPTQTAKVRFNVNGNLPHSSWLNGTTVKSLLGLSGATDNIITGSVTDDFCFRQDANQGFLFSTNASSTIDFAILANSGGFKFITPGGGVSDAWKFGNASSTTPTSPNRTVQISINGVTLYLHAKTSND